MFIFRSFTQFVSSQIGYNLKTKSQQLLNKRFIFISVAEISPENNIPFKIIVAEEQPRKFTPKFVDTLQNQNGSDSQEKATTKKECLPDELRGPKIVKVIYKAMKSVNSSIHTFALPSKYLI